MIVSEELKALSETQRNLLVGRAVSLYDANYGKNEIAEKLNISVELMDIVIEIIEQARKNRNNFKN